MAFADNKSGAYLVAGNGLQCRGNDLLVMFKASVSSLRLSS